MSNLNLISTTVAIISNLNIDNNEKTNTIAYTIQLEPIVLTKETFKKCFFPCNIYSPSEFVNVSKFNYYMIQQEKDKQPLSLYNESLKIFMSYNNITSESAINPKLLIDFSNDIFTFDNFINVPHTITSMSWKNIMNWLNVNKDTKKILSLHIEFHYYNQVFMPEPIKYIFRYFIC